jgi:hypothetical protein
LAKAVIFEIKKYDDTSHCAKWNSNNYKHNVMKELEALEKYFCNIVLAIKNQP